MTVTSQNILVVQAPMWYVLGAICSPLVEGKKLDNSKNSNLIYSFSH